MEKPVRPKVPEEAKIKIALTDEQKKELEGKNILSLFVKGDELVGTDMNTDAYKGHAEKMATYKKDRKAFKSEKNAARVQRIKGVAEKKAVKAIKSEAFGKRKLAKAKEDEVKLEKRLKAAKALIAANKE